MGAGSNGLSLGMRAVPTSGLPPSHQQRLTQSNRPNHREKSDFRSRSDPRVAYLRSNHPPAGWVQGPSGFSRIAEAPHRALAFARIGIIGQNYVSKEGPTSVVVSGGALASTGEARARSRLLWEATGGHPLKLGAFPC